MKAKIFLASLILGTTPAMVTADEEADLIINGEKLNVRAPAPDHVEMLGTIRSGWTFRSSETQALEMDDFDNPGMIFVDDGLESWDTAEGDAGKSCASCHGAIDEGMKGVRASMPKMNPDGTDLWTLEETINNCRTERMEAEPWGWESRQMLAMTAAVGLQSRGMTVDVEIDGPARDWWEKGKELYYTRVGQLDMACSNCHEDNYGNMIRADHLSQGQINGFPVYRLKWAGLGSIHRRFKGCMKNIRAEPYSRGSDEFKALELYVASRGAGLDVETPSVRN